MERRKLTKEDIDKVRDIEGFPIGTDEDIIALSNAPYYTACPNPFIKEFIEENGHPYDEETDNYQCEPYASDISEGKTDPIYMAHTYHTKVPHKAIMHYILHYTKPGDLVLDGFCGTGMTALAAKICGSDRLEDKNGFSKEELNNWGPRNAINSDLSPIATFIAHNYLNDVDPVEFNNEFSELIGCAEQKFGKLYQTRHNSGRLLPGIANYGVINYVVWSDVFICPHCGEELIFWDIAIENNTVKKELICPKCGAILKKASCKRSRENLLDERLNQVVSVAKQVPVMINYTFGGKKFEKKPDSEDLERITEARNELKNVWLPIDELPDGDNTAQPINSHNFRYVHQFYYDRSALIFSYILNEADNYKYSDTIKFIVTSILMKTGSKLHNIGFKNGKINLAGAMPNVLYVPSTVAERNIITLLNGKFKDICKIYSPTHSKSKVLIQCCSATDMTILPNSIDYIFTDPPFGSNINYSEMNYLWESWIGVKTENSDEAIVNKTQKKSLLEYQNLMTRCFEQYYAALKPGRWITIEFHNSLNSVWNAIQESILRSGFVIADVRTLDKKQGTFKQMTTMSAVKQDLVISAYKPRENFQKDFKLKAGSEEGVWSFIRQHLAHLPIAPDGDHDGKIDIVADRQAFLLYDRMVAWHIIHGLAIPIDANSFYNGLDEHFLKRDNMYFLPEQVNEYDQKRAFMELENVQLSFAIQDEKGAIQWLNYQLSEPQTYQELQPKYLQELHQLRSEKMPELMDLLKENFLQDEHGKWYVPDITKAGDVAKLREKSLLKEFESYLQSKGKLKVYRSEAIRAGFSKLWKEKDYKNIVAVAERLPEQVVQEDPNLLMYYDISLSRL